jgi:hypothetical protein
MDRKTTHWADFRPVFAFCFQRNKDNLHGLYFATLTPWPCSLLVLLRF